MREFIDRFAGRRVLVVGDVILDRAIAGTASRISPEAPVPVVADVTRLDSLGGAANVAAGVAALGAIARLVGITGDDDERAALLQLLAEADIDAGALLAVEGRPTTVKTRIVADGRQIARVDVEQRRTVDADLLTTSAIVALDEGIDAVILSDYALGVLSAELVAWLLAEAGRRGIPTIVDPKHADLGRYRGATIVTPNLREFAQWCEPPLADVHDGDAIGVAAVALAVANEIDTIVVTRGTAGLLACGADGSVHAVPARPIPVFDVTGAGDSVVATIGVAVAAGVPIRTAGELANLSGSLAVSGHGTVVVAASDLYDALDRPPPAPVLERSELLALVDAWRSAGRRIVFTNGCFDVLHRGHVAVLRACRQEGDVVVVGVNSDDSVRRLKGEGRPLMAVGDRAAMLAELRSVDAVVVFAEDDPAELVEAILPDVIVKGGDYRREEVIGGDVVTAAGGRIVIVPTVEGYSTTALVTGAS